MENENWLYKKQREIGGAFINLSDEIDTEQSSTMLNNKFNGYFYDYFVEYDDD